MTPPFLAHLDLPEDADERAIKRAYARQLKQIDQAADPAGFQALREAYEAALHWHHTRDAREAQAAQDDGEAPAPGDDTASDATEDSGDTEAAQPDDPAPAEPQPHAEVIEVVNGFMAGLTSHDGDKASMLKALAACMDDPRLLGLDARDMFEWFIARSLAEGWRPGHEVLLVAAIEFFEWSHDRRRLMRFGRVGQTLDESIAERMVFDGLPLPAHARQKEVIRLLRRAPRAEDPAQARTYRQDLEWLVQNFPNWLWMIVPAERVQQWRQWAGDGPSPQSAPPEGLSPAVSRPSHPAQQVPIPVAQPRQTSSWWFFVAIIMMLGTLSNALKNYQYQGPRDTQGAGTTLPTSSANSSTSPQAPAQTSESLPPYDALKAIRSYGDLSTPPPRESPFPVSGQDAPLPPMFTSSPSTGTRPAREGASHQRAENTAPGVADAAPGAQPSRPPAAGTARISADALEQAMNPVRDPWAVQFKAPPMPSSTTTPPAVATRDKPATEAPREPSGSGLSRTSFRDPELPKVEMPVADYRLNTTSNPSLVNTPAPPENR